MKYCNYCSAPLVQRIPDDDDRPRHVCEQCGAVHYQNPRIVVGCLPEYDGNVLLCKRAIEPRRGYWTLPAGFMENGETTQEGAARETWEEAGARVDIGELYCVFNLPHINQVYMFFRAPLAAPEFAAGKESLEVGLFTEADIPWGELAFPVITQTLEVYFQDRRSGHYPTRMIDIRQSLFRGRQSKPST